MNIIQKLLAAVRNWRWFGSADHMDNFADLTAQLRKPLWVSREPITDPTLDIPPTPAEMANRRLKQIADQRIWLIANKRQLLDSRKAFYRPLRDLTNEEIAISSGKQVWNGSEWVFR